MRAADIQHDGIVPLTDAFEEQTFGGKAISLGAALRAGLPVPPGVGLSWAFVDRVARGDAAALAALAASTHVPDARLAARSSAVGEDSGGASFAGQHVTKLNVRRPGLQTAVRAVWESAHAPSALAYRARKGVSTPPRIGVVIQMLVEPRAAGVLFTRNPLTGADERLIESSWGLGEAVVNGSVNPDRYRLDRRGRLVESTPGLKDLKIWYGEGEGEGTIELPVDDHLHTAPSLDPSHLAALHDLAERCEAVYGQALDIEWAVDAAHRLHLLQCRPITTA